METKSLTLFKRIMSLSMLCALAVALSLPATAWAEQPRPNTPQDKLKSPDRPNVPANVINPEDAVPAAKRPFFHWMDNIDKDKPRIHLGSLELRPYGSIEEKFDTNIFLEPHGLENEDWITDYRAGLSAKMPLVASRGDDYMAEGYYHADFIEFLHQDKLSRVDHTAHGSVTCDLPNDVGIQASEDFLRTQDPPDTERTLLTKRWCNIMDGRVNYTREKIKLEGACALTTNSYDAYPNLNYNDFMVTATTFYNVATKTWLFSELNFGSIKYYKGSATNSGSQYYQGRVGVEGKIAPKLTGTMKFGYRYQDYSRTQASNFAALVAFGNLKYEITERTTANIYGDSTPIESTYATNSYYQASTVGLKLDHLLLQRLWLNGSGFWGLNLYPTESTQGNVTTIRGDTLWGAGTGLKYEVKDWLFLNTGYAFKQRDSNFHNYSYNDHQISFRVSVAF
ncbi:MAG: outer membrane beta-barrel protein [Candidatus Omnitrophica bacterium]|nr:outer membrane beta-barrel protein [Candidatus Omnitrophota bacterium]